MDTARHGFRTAVVLILAMAITACASPVGVKQIDVQSGYRVQSQNALSSDRLSDASMIVLRRFGLLEQLEREPAAVLERLHQDIRNADDDRLFSLAELSLWYAMRTHDRSRFLAAAIYAYALLFPGNGSTVRLVASDPRLRLAFDIYNVGLAEGLTAGEPPLVELSGSDRALPFGTLHLDDTGAQLDWGGFRLERFVSTARIEPRGLRNRYRQPGLGASLAASIAVGEANALIPGAHRIGPRMKVPVTLLLRLTDPRASLETRQLSGRLELYAANTARSVMIDGQQQLLESDTTAAFALQLEGNPLYDVELSGLLRGGVIQSLLPKDRAQDGLAFLQPYQRGHIPLVLVHGTASSPARWAELVNELHGDESIMSRYQVWLFLYDSGSPIAFSAGRLRTALTNAVKELDPEGKDAALQSMVVAGHSQGGLLTKLLVIDSGDRFWNMLSEKPFDSIVMSEPTRDLLRQSVFFTPLPFVKRVIFIATPHRGARMAQGRLGALAARLVRLPAGIVGQVGQVVATEDEALLAQVRRPANAIQNMNPSHRSIRALAEIPVVPGIPVNSIVAVKGTGPVETGNDGVVDYSSAHIEGVESELIVRAAHSVQGNPEAIEEIRRILHVHAAQHPAAAP